MRSQRSSIVSGAGAAALAAVLASGLSLGADESQSWRRVQSQNFVAIGDASERDLLDMARRLERFRTALGEVFPALTPKPGGAATLVLFKDHAGFMPFAPRDGRNKRMDNVAGYFKPSPHGDMFVLGNRTDDSGRQVVFHEYVHRVVFRNLGDIPAWVNEGLADLYSTFQIEEKRGTAIVGLPPQWRVLSLRNEPWIPLRDIVDSDAAIRLRRQSPQKVPTWYAESWAFVHFLLFSDKARRAPQLMAYLDAVRAGKSNEAAFTGAFGGSFFDIENELRSYMRVGMPAVRMTTDSAGAGDTGEGFRVRRLTVAEAEAAQGCLLIGGFDEKAERHLTAALTDDPRNVDARACLGAERAYQDRAADALSILEPLAGEAHESVPAHQYLGFALDKANRPEDAARAYRRVTELAPDFIGGWHGLSLSALELRRDAESDAALDRLMVLAGSESALRARALRAIARDRADIAAADAQRFIAKQGLSDDSGFYMAFLGAIAYRRLGQDAEAVRLLADVEAAVDRRSWTARVLAYVQGKLDAKAFMDAARDDGERTEAHTYVGLSDLHAGRVAEAKAHFTWVKDRGTRTYAEYELAKQTLARLERDTRKDPGDLSNMRDGP